MFFINAVWHLLTTALWLVCLIVCCYSLSNSQTLGWYGTMTGCGGSTYTATPPLNGPVTDTAPLLFTCSNLNMRNHHSLYVTPQNWWLSHGWSLRLSFMNVYVCSTSLKPSASILHHPLQLTKVWKYSCVSWFSMFWPLKFGEEIRHWGTWWPQNLLTLEHPAHICIFALLPMFGKNTLPQSPQSCTWVFTPEYYCTLYQEAVFHKNQNIETRWYTLPWPVTALKCGQCIKLRLKNALLFFKNLKICNT